jgi:YD repeat-containing protein
MGDKALKYIKRADGTWTPPPGITTQLSANGDSTFSLLGRYGARIDFDTKRRISDFTDIDNNTIAFNYNPSDNTLSTIQDNFGHSLTLTYTGGRISSISDSAGRLVSYGYTSDNLTSYTDPELKVWGFGYDTDNNHLLTSLTNPLTITTVTNVYDTLNRMKTQTVPRKDGTGNVYNVTYNFYFSGFMNMEEDPDGNIITYYFDKKGRLIGEENALGISGQGITTLKTT